VQVHSTILNNTLHNENDAIVIHDEVDIHSSIMYELRQHTVVYTTKETTRPTGLKSFPLTNDALELNFSFC